MTLPNVLRIVAALIAAVALGEFFVLGVFLVPPFVVAAVLFLLSFAHNAWPVATACAAIVLCVVVPVGAIMGYLEGDLVLLIPIFDVVVFAWLLWTAIRSLRSRQSI